jgi:hypothetical protein
MPRSNAGPGHEPALHHGRPIALGRAEAADARAQAEQALAAFEQRRQVRSAGLERQLHAFQLIG